ncbi:uncharacterized protein EAE97_011605 [Botrytis byssoidea]|uniref:Uncharacterized protein n=1 Tax=Botrytis byssoidea TaxID=139641 RepID=A0A9P5I0M5_9HELO|nr:uncharacterized protein EAE97_011605 [Botrytis byssoidea]KAF7919687.1 hypothetical protein EAE97_011605 [Botrytis byssoidea]
MQMIAKHLTPASAGSFFLTCRQIGLVIGTQYIDGLKTSKDDTIEFLNLLEHDLQDQIVCTLCRKLHKMRIAERYDKNYYCLDGYTTDPEISGLPEFERIPSCVIDDDLRHFHRLFGNDAQTQRLLRLLSAPENYAVDKFCRSLTTEKRGKCRIKNGSMVTRKFMNYRWKCQSLDAPGCIPICSHLNLWKVDDKFCDRLYCDYGRHEDIWSASQPPCQKNTGTDENNTSRHVHSHHNRYLISRCNTALAIVVYKQFESEEDWKRHLPLYGSDNVASEPLEFCKEKISSVFEVDDTGFGPGFPSWSDFYLAWQKVFLDEVELGCLAIILLLLYWHST